MYSRLMDEFFKWIARKTIEIYSQEVYIDINRLVDDRICLTTLSYSIYSYHSVGNFLEMRIGGIGEYGPVHILISVD